MYSNWQAWFEQNQIANIWMLRHCQELQNLLQNLLQKHSHIDAKKAYYLNNDLATFLLEIFDDFNENKAFKQQFQTAELLNLLQTAKTSTQETNPLHNNLEHQADLLIMPYILKENAEALLDCAWRKLSHNGLLYIEAFNPLSVQFLSAKLMRYFQQNAYAQYLPELQTISPDVLQGLLIKQGWKILSAKYHVYDFLPIRKPNAEVAASPENINKKYMQYEAYETYEAIGQRWFARFGLSYYFVLQKTGIGVELSQKSNYHFAPLKHAMHKNLDQGF